MPLNPTTLAEQFLRQFHSARISGRLDVARALADTYSQYALTASSAYGLFVPTGTEKLRLESILAAALVPSAGAATAVAVAWGTGIQAFWTGAVFGTGVGSVVPGVPVMVGSLTALLTNPLNTAESAAATMASLIDAGTRTLLIVGPGGPVPVV